MSSDGLLTMAHDFWANSLIQTWAAFLIIGLAVEVFLKADRGQPLRDLLLNFRYGAVYVGVIFLLAPSLAVFVNGMIQALGAGWIDIDVFSQGSFAGQVGAAICSVAVLDFFYYWWHRAQHSYGWLWDQHAVHHSDKSLNISTSMRHHWSEFLFQGLLIAVPMGVLFKMTPVSMWTLSMVVSGWTWFIHMNIRLHLGRLSWLVCGPQVHRVHHSCMAQHVDKNFAAYTPIWDVLFGTYYAPSRDEYPPTGLIGGKRIETVVEAAIYPFKGWAKRMGRMMPASPRARDAR